MAHATFAHGLAVIGLLALPAVAVPQRTATVPSDYTTIQEAISALDHGDTVLVLPGVYVENISFLGKNLTVESTGGAEVTTIDGGALDSVVTFENQENSSAQLRGFTITNGHGTDGVWPARGGGVHCAPETSPTIEACIITKNQGGGGALGLGAGAGGIHCRQSEATIRNCVIEDNIGGQAADEQSSDGGAGGISFVGGAPVVVPIVEYCTIRGNLGGGGGDIGSLVAGPGGILVRDSLARVVRCLIENNVGGSCGTGNADVGGAGGIAVVQRPQVKGTSEIDSCVIRGNLGGSDGASGGSGGGGGIRVSNGAWPKISNCLIYGNTGGFTGTTTGDDGAAGGIQCEAVFFDDPVILNCTIVGNTGGLGAGPFSSGAGGVDSSSSDRLRIVNSIVWGNTGDGNAADNVNATSGQPPLIRYSLIGGGWVGNGNLNADPLFAGPTTGDFRLQCGSPCLDAGTSLAGGISAPLDDFDGKPRDDGLIDIGAHEYGLRPENYCVAAPNSYSPGALIGFFGSTSVTGNSFNLRADCVPDTPGLFFYGPNPIQVAFGDGFTCVGGAIERLSPGHATNHALTRYVDLPNTPIVGGSTWNFQAWFRDPAAGGAGFNTSNAVGVTFAP